MEVFNDLKYIVSPDTGLKLELQNFKIFQNTPYRVKFEPSLQHDAKDKVINRMNEIINADASEIYISIFGAPSCEYVFNRAGDQLGEEAEPEVHLCRAPRAIQASPMDKLFMMFRIVVPKFQNLFLYQLPRPWLLCIRRRR